MEEPPDAGLRGLEAAPPALRLFLAGSGTDPCFRAALFLPASPPALFAVVPSPFSGSGAGRGTGTTRNKALLYTV